MNLKSKYKKFLNDVRTLEGQYKNKVQNGSKNPMDYHYLSYYSGVINGFSLAFEPLDHDMTEADLNESIKKVLQMPEVGN